MKGGGKCGYCSEHFSPIVITEHLRSCDLRGKNSPYLKGDQHSFLIRVNDIYTANYWVFIEVDGRTCLLKDIDSFLRNLWLECCGHLSSFKINGQNYDSHPDPSNYSKAKSMQVRVDSILKEGMIFEYMYDFGTSTELVLEVISAKFLDNGSSDVRASGTGGQKRMRKRTGRGGGREMIARIKLVARNDPLLFACHKCKKATEIGRAHV